MTDAEMIEAANLRKQVVVKANDYSYNGWIVMVGQKTSGQWRCVVEDHNGRMFIHNAGQLSAL